MGCGSSKPSMEEAVEMHAPRPQQRRSQIQVSAPTGGPVMVPPVYRDRGGRPIQHASSTLTSDTIQRALDNMATYLMQQGVLANIVTVGGAVNTLYLHSRESTQDVDFFLANPQAPEHTAIYQAARYANRQTNGMLGADWFNNATQMMMGRRLQGSLATAAFEQNTLIYQRVDGRSGLRVYAAPWSYAFCGKLNRLSAGNARSYDLADAVAYLYEHLRASGRQTVSASRIRRWCQEYGKENTDAVLHQVDEAYRQRYGRRPVDFTR